MNTDFLVVPGARVYYEVRGDGPLLLVSQSGEGDAGRSRQMVDHLVDRYTVVTYDRRGLSRSVLDDPGQPVTMSAHTDDAHRLLAALGAGPAYLLGCSFGALIGLRLAIAHPGQVDLVVAHEPIALGLLPADERADADRKLARLEEIHRDQGWVAAVRQMAAVLGIDPHAQDAEPDVELAPITEERAANFAFFLERDIPAARRDTVDGAAVVALVGGPTRIVPAGGRGTPRTMFDYRCAEELAATLAVDVEPFPGGHNGNLTHPRAFAARVHEVLTRHGQRAAAA